MTTRLPRATTFGQFAAGAFAAAMLAIGAPAQAAWEPAKPVEFVVPAGTGGGADQMARLIQGIVVKHNLMKQPLVVVNKSGGAGAEGFLDVKNAKGDPHKIIITLSNLFTTPLATGVPFNWKDLTPVRMMALDQFVLWVPADAPYKSAADYIQAVKAGGNNKFSFKSKADSSLNGKAGELCWYKKSGDTFVIGDVNGDRKADFILELDGRLSLTKGDFIL